MDKSIKQFRQLNIISFPRDGSRNVEWPVHSEADGVTDRIAPVVALLPLRCWIRRLERHLKMVFSMTLSRLTLILPHAGHLSPKRRFDVKRWSHLLHKKKYSGPGQKLLSIALERHLERASAACLRIIAGSAYLSASTGINIEGVIFIHRQRREA